MFDLDNLLNCPFCGRRDHLSFCRGHNDAAEWAIIECKWCNLKMRSSSTRRVVKRWNARLPPA